MKELTPAVEEYDDEFELRLEGDDYLRCEVRGFRGRPDRGEVVHAMTNPVYWGGVGGRLAQWRDYRLRNPQRRRSRRDDATACDHRRMDDVTMRPARAGDIDRLIAILCDEPQRDMLGDRPRPGEGAQPSVR